MGKIVVACLLFLCGCAPRIVKHNGFEYDPIMGLVDSRGIIHIFTDVIRADCEDLEAVESCADLEQLVTYHELFHYWHKYTTEDEADAWAYKKFVKKHKRLPAVRDWYKGN